MKKIAKKFVPFKTRALIKGKNNAVVSGFLLLLIELLVIFLPALAFLYFYEKTARNVPEGAFEAHLGLLITVWACLLLARLWAWRFFKRSASCWITLASTLTSTCLWIYYAAATIGLIGFGKIITWPILKPYLLNPEQTLDYAGFSVFWALLLLSFAGGLVILFWWWLIGSRDWVRPLSAVGTRLFFIISIGMACAIAVRAFDLLGNPPNYVGEPLSMTFFPPPLESINNKIYHHRPHLELVEDQVRKERLSAGKKISDINAIVIVSDALRADHMTPYGYARDTTPHLMSRLHKNAAARPMAAMAVCAETICGMPGLLYSKPPELMHATAIGLAEVLKAHGYKSYVLLSGDHSNYFGLGRIYGPADIYIDGSLQKARFVNDDMLLLDAAESLPQHEDGTPAYIKILLQSNHVLGTRLAGSNWYQPAENYASWLAKGLNDIEKDKIELATNYYDNGVRQADLMIEKLLVELEKKGYLEKAIVLITGDHGEMLGEHNLLSHTVGVYQPVLSVPAIFLQYGHRAENIHFRQWTSQMDLAPTIIDALGIDAIPSWAGVALQKKDDRPYFSFQQKWVSGLMILDGEYRGHKYWFDAKSQQDFVFDLRGDILEENNMSSSIPKDILGHWRSISLKNMIDAGG